MLKRFVHFLFVLVLILSATSFAVELDQVISAGVLRVAVKDTRRAPFVTLDQDGRPQGFEIDFVQTCAKLLKVNLQFIVCDSSNEMIDAVADGRADIALGLLSRTPDRILRVYFTIPYAQPHMALLIHRQKFSQLKQDVPLEVYLHQYQGIIVAYQGTGHLETSTRLFPEASIKSATQNEVDTLVTNKELTAFFSDQMTIRSILDAHPGSRVFYQRIVFDDLIDNICIAVPIDCPRLLYWLNCGLEGGLKSFQNILIDKM